MRESWCVADIRKTSESVVRGKKNFDGYGLMQHRTFACVVRSRCPLLEKGPEVLPVVWRRRVLVVAARSAFLRKSRGRKRCYIALVNQSIGYSWDFHMTASGRLHFANNFHIWLTKSFTKSSQSTVPTKLSEAVNLENGLTGNPHE